VVFVYIDNLAVFPYPSVTVMYFMSEGLVAQRMTPNLLLGSIHSLFISTC
jgi:hypothetical protein